AVGRVEDAGNGFRAGFLLHRTDVVAGIEALQVQFTLGASPPQSQGVDAVAAPASDWRVVGHGADALSPVPEVARLALAGNGRNAAAEADQVADLGPFELPGIAEIQPAFGLLLLPAVDDGLAKQAVLVANAIAVGGNTE